VESSLQCEVCHIGTRRAQRTTYAYWTDGQLVLMPNVAVWVCDVCADVEYDLDAITRLEQLLGIEPTFRDTESRVSALTNADGLSPLAASRRRSA
jgi:YgiT-type zinc finger domain-containing protein